MLEHIAPWDYHAMRPALGHGSGFDSPGFRRTHDVSPALGVAFHRLLGRRRLTLDALYRDSHAARRRSSRLAERLVDWDERLILWRALHLKLVERVIGGHVIGTQGTPVEVLGRRIDVRYFEELWDVRNALTKRRTRARNSRGDVCPLLTCLLVELAEPVRLVAERARRRRIGVADAVLHGRHASSCTRRCRCRSSSVMFVKASNGMMWLSMRPGIWPVRSVWMNSASS